MRKPMLILLLLLVWVQPILSQQESEDVPRRFSFSVTMLDQPGSPLVFVEEGVLTPKLDVAFAWFTIKNESRKAIIGWEVQGFDKGRAVGRWTEGLGDEGRSDLVQVVLEPGQEKTIGRFSHEFVQRVLNEQVTKIAAGSLRSIHLDLAVVKVAFADGSKYDATEWLRSLNWQLWPERRRIGSPGADG